MCLSELYALENQGDALCTSTGDNTERRAWTLVANRSLNCTVRAPGAECGRQPCKVTAEREGAGGQYGHPQRQGRDLLGFGPGLMKEVALDPSPDSGRFGRAEGEKGLPG